MDSDVQIEHASSSQPRKALVIHQEAGLDHPRVVPLSLHDRLDLHAYEHQVLLDDLDEMPLLDLRELFQGYSSHESSGARLLILESMLPKVEAAHQSQHETVTRAEVRMISIAYAQALLALQKFWRARKFLNSLPKSLDWTSQETAQVARLKFLSHIGDQAHAPIDPRSLEELAIDLVSCECASSENIKGPSNANLVFAYLMWLYGINDLPLLQSSLVEIKSHIESQLTLPVGEVLLSCEWLVQQYARWCLRHGRHCEARGSLQQIAEVVRECDPGDVTRTQTRKLQEMCYNLGSVEQGGSDTVITIYEKTDADSIWIYDFQQYIRDHQIIETSRRAVGDASYHI